MEQSAEIGLIGLAVMGRNLALNMADHGFTVAVYNRTRSTTDSFIRENTQPNLIPCHDLRDLCASLRSPRRILLMIKAGKPVDACIDELLPLLDTGDIIIDGGNSHFSDSERRYRQLQDRGIRFVGAGISGGETGARNGPAIMPGGDKSAWPWLESLLPSIAAKVDDEPCCSWIGPGGAGHYVKMVHNGIEYGDMQLISEAYALLRYGLDLPPTALHRLFSEWNQGVLDSYLMAITADILNVYEGDQLLLDYVADSAEQKGTGRWTALDALEKGSALTLISEAVFARMLSAQKARRVETAKRYRHSVQHTDNNGQAMKDAIHSALYAGKIICYSQGFLLLRETARANDWPLDYTSIARLWRGGCIIRSRFLNDIAAAFENNPALDHLLLDDFFRDALQEAEEGLRTTVKLAVDCHIATPALSAALAWFDGIATAESPANLIQAQRDYFGAHTYQRKDKPDEQTFHSDWQLLAGQQESQT